MVSIYKAQRGMTSPEVLEHRFASRVLMLHTLPTNACVYACVCVQEPESLYKALDRVHYSIQARLNKLHLYLEHCEKDSYISDRGV